MARFILAAGGTGGHIFPALAVAEIMQKQGHDVMLYTDKRGAPMIEGKASYQIIASASPFAGNVIKKSVAMVKLGLGFCQSLLMMITKRPKAVIGFGGYPSFAPCASARLLGIATFLHEQNAVMGRANRLLAKLCQLTALSWQGTAGLPKDSAHIVTGLPVRQAFFALADYQPKDASDKCHIVVIGGSLGARLFAETVPEGIALLAPELQKSVTITQQARTDQMAALKSAYERLGITAHIAPFFHDIAACYDTADIIISRSGASSVAEISASGRPAILIPFPDAMDDHQTGNAKALSTDGGAILLDEASLSASHLASLLTDILHDNNRRCEMAHSARRLSVKDAATLLAKTVTDAVLPPQPSATQQGSRS